MGSLNCVHLIGRMGKDPEVKNLDSGNIVVNFSLATSERYKDKSGEQQEKTEWHRCFAWNKVAEIISQYTKKGSMLYVQGSIETREWNDKDGNKRFNTEINVRNVQFLDSKPSSDESGADQEYQKDAQNGQSDEDFVNSDAPF